MLQFTGVNTGGFAQDSPPPYETVIGSPTNTYSSYSSYTSSYGVRLHTLAPALITVFFLENYKCQHIKLLIPAVIFVEEP